METFAIVFLFISAICTSTACIIYAIEIRRLHKELLRLKQQLQQLLTL